MRLTTYIGILTLLCGSAVGETEVSISGGIKNKGTYTLKHGQGLFDLIQAAGGYDGVCTDTSIRILRPYGSYTGTRFFEFDLEVLKKHNYDIIIHNEDLVRVPFCGIPFDSGPFDDVTINVKKKGLTSHNRELYDYNKSNKTLISAEDYSNTSSRQSMVIYLVPHKTMFILGLSNTSCNHVEEKDPTCFLCDFHNSEKFFSWFKKYGIIPNKDAMLDYDGSMIGVLDTDDNHRIIGAVFSTIEDALKADDKLKQYTEQATRENGRKSRVSGTRLRKLHRHRPISQL